MDAMRRIDDAMRVGDRILKCAVFLGLLHGDDRFEPLSTAFLVAKGSPDLAFLHVVTTQHSVMNRPKLWVRLNRLDGRAHVSASPIERWYFHPDSDNRFVDVAVAPVLFPTDVFDYATVYVDSEISDKETIAKRDIGIGDEVFYPGLFMHHVGSDKNLPLLRAGTIATMPDEMVRTGSGRQWLYLIESRSIGGHSGSPVFNNMLAPRSYFREKMVRLPMPGENYPYPLLGMIRSHFTAEDSGEYVTPDPERERLWVNTGIATVVPAWEIKETIDQQELADERAEELKNYRAQSPDVPD
jgi:hypothetical protein